MDDLPFTSLAELAGALRRRELSPVELIESCLARIDMLDPILAAFITVTPERAMAAAKRAEAEIERGEYRGPLHGIPVAHKDNIETAGVLTTAGTRALHGNVPAGDADIVARFARAGAIVVGKTNLHELACGAMGAYRVTRNAWDLTRAAGGSSSGSATAVAAGLVMAATGSETGGSVRVPASFSGIVGLKPTAGRLSSRGIIPISTTLDDPGLLARSASDASLLFGGICNPSEGEDQLAAEGSLTGLRVGVVRERFLTGVEPTVTAALATTARDLAGLGARLVEVAVPEPEEVAPVHQLIWLSEAAVCLRRFLFDRTLEVGTVVRDRLRPGALISAGEYVRASQARRQLTWRVDELFREVDLLLSPTTPFSAYRLDDFATARSDVSRFNRLTNLTGHPSLAVPCGLTEDGLPVGVQLVGRHWQEELLLRAGFALEQAHSGSKDVPDAAEGHHEATRNGTAHELPSGLWTPTASTGPDLPEELLPTLEWVKRRVTAFDLELDDAECASAARQLHRTLSMVAAWPQS